MLRRLITEGFEIPRGYAVSYRAFDRDASVAYPYGLHWLVRWTRDLRFWVMWVGYPGFRDETEHRLYVLGSRREDDAAEATIRHYSALLREARAQAAVNYQRGWDAAFKSMDEALAKRIAS